MPRETVSIIVPCYNEEDVIEICHREITSVVDDIKDYDFEIIYVDDGSTDNTPALLQKIFETDKRTKIIFLSRNFGKENAMTAGLDNVTSDAVIILDADLQDPPALIPDMIKIWKEQNADVVYGQRVKRNGETGLKKITSWFFYYILNVVSDVKIPRNTGDFRLMNKRAVNALMKLREHHRFMKGLFSWIGYKQVPLEYERQPRAAGTTKWNYFRLFHFAIEGITGFSISLLRIASVLGMLISSLSFIYGVTIIGKTLIFGADVPGYPSLLVVITFLGGIQLLTIGIMGEYIGRIFNETKQRPLYFIEKRLD